MVPLVCKVYQTHGTREVFLWRYQCHVLPCPARVKSPLTRCTVSIFHLKAAGVVFGRLLSLNIVLHCTGCAVYLPCSESFQHVKLRGGMGCKVFFLCSESFWHVLLKGGGGQGLQGFFTFF